MPSHPASLKYEFKIQVLSPAGTGIGTSEPFKATRAAAQRRLLAVLRKGFKSQDHAIIYGGRLVKVGLAVPQKERYVVTGGGARDKKFEDRLDAIHEAQTRAGFNGKNAKMLDRETGATRVFKPMNPNPKKRGRKTSRRR